MGELLTGVQTCALPIFDGNLDEGGDILASSRLAGDGIGVAAEGGERVAQGRALGVDDRQHSWIEGAGDGARAGEGGREAHALLVAKGDDFDGIGQALW